MAASDDPITFELFRNAIFAIADEMALTVFPQDRPATRANLGEIDRRQLEQVPCPGE